MTCVCYVCVGGDHKQVKLYSVKLKGLYAVLVVQ